MHRPRFDTRFWLLHGRLPLVLHNLPATLGLFTIAFAGWLHSAVKIIGGGLHRRKEERAL